MELITFLIDFILHLDTHLVELIQKYGTYIYGILFLIVFCETGLVVTPFLPGDSLLFTIGLLAYEGDLNLALVFVLLSIAAILGDTVNYWIGAKIGPKVFTSESSRWLNREHLVRTHAFYEKYGGKTIIIARFMPIIRTFAPFVAGIGRMTYPKFLLYNVVGGLLWIGLFLLAGYLAGYWIGKKVKGYLTPVIFAIIILSVLPAVVEYWRARRPRAAGNSGQ
jgi:membrane-associated protein